MSILKNQQKTTEKKPTRTIILSAVIFTGIGILIGTLITNATHTQDATISQNPIRLARDGNYQFISPLLVDSDVTNNDDQVSQALTTKIHDITYDLLDDPSINLVSVYFRDLTSAASVGIKQDQLFDSGSLLKVSLLIAALKENEASPGFLSEKIFYPGRSQPVQDAQFEGLIAGNTYSVQDLLNYMIIKSDNDAKDLLFVTLDPKYINDLFQVLKLPTPNPNSQYQISPRTFSYFFRILYNATYLTPSDSELALTLLSKTAYADGIVAGVPRGTTVAHKFGQFVTYTPGQPDLWELHDCGIVYTPNHPYFLCIMTRGTSLPSLTDIVASTSEAVYQEVQNGFQ